MPLGRSSAIETLPGSRVGHFTSPSHLPCMSDIAVHDASPVASTVRLAAQGDEASFTRLVAEHRVAMARVAFVICGDPDVTRDAVQAAWSIAWRRLPSLRNPDQIRPWLVAIAANEARRTVRGQRGPAGGPNPAPPGPGGTA